MTPFSLYKLDRRKPFRKCSLSHPPVCFHQLYPLARRSIVLSRARFRVADDVDAAEGDSRAHRSCVLSPSVSRKCDIVAGGWGGNGVPLGCRRSNPVCSCTRKTIRRLLKRFSNVRALLCISVYLVCGVCFCFFCFFLACAPPSPLLRRRRRFVDLSFTLADLCSAHK